LPFSIDPTYMFFLTDLAAFRLAWKDWFLPSLLTLGHEAGTHRFWVELTLIQRPGGRRLE
jgi:hypothetical protein